MPVGFFGFDATRFRDSAISREKVPASLTIRDSRFDAEDDPPLKRILLLGVTERGRDTRSNRSWLFFGKIRG